MNRWVNKEKRLRGKTKMREESRKFKKRRSEAMETRVQEPCYVGVRMHQESGRGVRNMEKKSAQAKQEDRES